MPTITTPSFFDDLAEKCAKTKFDTENKWREEVASFKGLLTEMWEKQKHALAEKAVKNGDHFLTACFDIGLLNFKVYKPDIYNFRDNLPDEFAEATKGKDAQKGHVYPVNPYRVAHEGELPKFACKVVFQHATDAHLKEWRTERDEERDAPAAKKPKLEPEPEVKEEPA